MAPSPSGRLPGQTASAANGPVERPASAGGESDWQQITVSICAYGITLLSMATVGLLAPVVARLAALTGGSIAQVGVAISLYSIPSALCSGAIGRFVDLRGARSILLVSSLLASIAAFALWQATSLWTLRIGLLGAGIAFCGIVVSAPALIVERLDHGRRAKMLSLWSSYGPAGFAIGLLLAIPFGQTGHWRAGLLIDAVLLIVGAGLTASLPRAGRRHVAQPLSWRGVLIPIRNAGIARLALALALPTGISYGTSLLMPSYLAASYGVTIATASGFVAFAKLLIVTCGGLGSGWLLARNVRATPLFLTLAAIAFVAQAILFFPGSGFMLAVGGLAVWLFAYAAMAGIAMALIPSLIADASETGAATGLVSQVISWTSFLGSIVYFSGLGWPAFIAIAAIGLLASCLFLPNVPAAASGEISL